MSYLGAIWSQIPPYFKVGCGGLLLVALITGCWIYWPAPGPDPAVKALEAQIEEKDKEIEQLKVSSAQWKQQSDEATAVGAARLDLVDKLETENAALRGRLQGVRKSGTMRAAAIDALGDEQLHDAVLTQLAATETAQGKP